MHTKKHIEGQWATLIVTKKKIWNFENVLFTHTHVNFFLNYFPFKKIQMSLHKFTLHLLQGKMERPSWPNRGWKSTCPLCKSWKPLYYGTCQAGIGHCAHLEILACSPVALQTTQVPWQIWDKLHYFYKCWNSQKIFSSKNTFLWRDNEESIGIFKKDIILVLEMESSNFVNYLTDMCWSCSCSSMYIRNGDHAYWCRIRGFWVGWFLVANTKAQGMPRFSKRNRRFVCRYLTSFLVVVSEIRSWCKSRIARSETRSFGIQLDVGFRFSSSLCWSAMIPVRCIFAEFFWVLSIHNKCLNTCTSYVNNVELRNRTRSLLR